MFSFHRPSEEAGTCGNYRSLEDAIWGNGGRPKGSSKKRKREIETATLAAKNEIVEKCKVEVRASKKRRLKKGRLDEIIKSVKINNNIPFVEIKADTIRQRIFRKTSFSDGVGRHTSPLLAMESTFVATIIKMARICQSLTPSQALCLINNMIEGTDVQKS